MKIPKFEFRSVSLATTYRFEVPEQLGGWALCTVNDATGELGIQSDFGNWAHRWSADPAHLGAPTLTHFIADRNACDYLAAKLLGRDGCYEWDRDATVREYRRRIVERRREDGHKIPKDHRRPVLTRDLAREMWEALGELLHAHDLREFLYGFMEDVNLTYWVSEHPFEATQDRPSRDYEILAKGILPALVEACAAEVKRRTPVNAEVRHAL